MQSIFKNEDGYSYSIISSLQSLVTISDTVTPQTSPRSDKNKEDLKHAANSTDKYFERVLEESDAVITENGYSADSLAGWQVTEARKV